VVVCHDLGLGSLLFSQFLSYFYWFAFSVIAIHHGKFIFFFLLIIENKLCFSRPRCLRRQQKKRFSPNSTSAKGNGIRSPAHPYAAHKTFRDDHDSARNNRPARPKNKATPQYMKPLQRTPRITPTSTPASTITVSPRSPTTTIQEAYVFGDKLASKLRIAEKKKSSMTSVQI
jgi:hypothetical protein